MIEIPKDPREQLRLKSKTYAAYVTNGLPRSCCRPFDLSPESHTENLMAQRNSSLWKLWCESQTHQLYILQWAMQHGSPGLQAVALFLARVGSLPDQPAAAAKDGAVWRACLRDDLADRPRREIDNVSEAATAALNALYALTRKLPYHADAFLAVLRPLLRVVPEANVCCAHFLETPRWAGELA